MTLTDLNNLAAQWASGMFRACWQGAIAVGLVWGICRLFPRLIPGLRATLWWLVCSKTLLGLVTAGPVQVVVLPATTPPAPSAARQIAYDASTRAALPASVTPALSLPGAASALRQPVVIVAKAKRIAPVSIALCVWLAGVLFLLTGVMRELKAARQLVRRAYSSEELGTAQDVARAVGLTEAPPVLVSDGTDSSVVVGLWRPVIVLCRKDLACLSPKELRALLAHELAHVRRHDLWAGGVPNLVRLLFFFNPLVWLACREYDLAREAACDAEALRVSGMMPADYGHLLLKLGVVSPPHSSRSGMAALGASAYGFLLRRRLNDLRALRRDSSPPPRWCSALVVAALVGALSLNPVCGEAGTSPKVKATTLGAKVPIPLASGTSLRRSIRQAVSKGATHKNVATKTVGAGIAVPSLVLSPLTAEASLPMKGKVPLTSAPLTAESVIKKEDLSMSKFTSGQHAKLFTTLSAMAIATVGVPILSQGTSAGEQKSSQVADDPVPAVPTAGIPQEKTPVPAGVPADRYLFTLRRGNSYLSHAGGEPVTRGQRELAKAQPGDCLVVDRDGRRYLITDAGVLNRVRENYAPVDAIGKKMEDKGKEMEVASKPMEELGKQMELKGKELEAIGARLEEQGKLLEESFKDGKPEAERQIIQMRMQELQRQMAVPQQDMQKLSEKMHGQGDRMRPLGDQLREYGRQVQAAVKEADARMVGILDAAFRDNLAVEQKVN